MLFPNGSSETRFVFYQTSKASYSKKTKKTVHGTGKLAGKLWTVPSAPRSWQKKDVFFKNKTQMRLCDASVRSDHVVKNQYSHHCFLRPGRSLKIAKTAICAPGDSFLRPIAKDDRSGRLWTASTRHCSVTSLRTRLNKIE